VNSKRVIAYFDGFNFYEGLRSKGWRHYYWLDLFKFCEQFLKRHQTLEAVRYFSAVQHNAEKALRQNIFFQANKMNDKFDLTLGVFKRRNKWKTIRTGGRRTSVNIEFWEEKKSDVSIASYMIRDVVLDKCDVTFLICADGDLTPPLDVIKELNPNHKLIVFFPPQTFSYDLRNKANKFVLLERHEEKFRNSLLPEKMTLANGHVLECPDKWK